MESWTTRRNEIQIFWHGSTNISDSNCRRNTFGYTLNIIQVIFWVHAGVLWTLLLFLFATECSRIAFREFILNLIPCDILPNFFQDIKSERMSSPFCDLFYFRLQTTTNRFIFFQRVHPSEEQIGTAYVYKNKFKINRHT